VAQGIWVDGGRPKSKKQVMEAVKQNPSSVSIEATSLFGKEYDGPVLGLPLGAGTIYFVGPDPYTKRNFYGQIFWQAGKLVVK